LPITERDKSRLAALIVLVRPARSIAARVQTLTDDQRAIYDGWNVRREQWVERCKSDCDDDNERDGRPYELDLQGRCPAPLRRDISEAVFGKVPRIPIAASDDQAQRIFQKECER
jgi:hypothetical protein